MEAIEKLRAFDPFAGREASPAAGPLSYLLLDVFTSEPLLGNPLAVFVDARGLDGDLLQRLARELNLSETVFVLPPERGGEVRVRIFTPLRELPFAGHPVLGTAAAVGTALGLDRVTLETGAGEIPVALSDAGVTDAGSGRAARGAGDRTTFGTMAQRIPTWGDFEQEGALLAALGVDRSLLPVQACVNGPRQVFVRVGDERELADLRPDLGRLSDLGELAVSCFVVDGHRVRSRMFAPALGVAEDPATGSAAGPLALHLARHGAIAFGARIEITQGVEIGRRSQLFAAAYGSRERVERIEVSGYAVILGVSRLLL